MKQIDWIIELEKKNKRWYRRNYLKKQMDMVRTIEFSCDKCERHIVMDINFNNLIDDNLYCNCGYLFKLGAEVVNYWIED